MTSLTFELTEDEAKVAAARAAWRASLSGGLIARHLAPLAAFSLAVLFAAILGWTGLVSRRAAEFALVLSAAAYMLYRLWTRRRFLVARREASAWVGGLRLAGPLTLTCEDGGLRLAGSSLEHAWPFGAPLEFETVSGLNYVWPPRGQPLIWPSRSDESEAFAALVRRRCGPRARPAASPDDDD